MAKMWYKPRGKSVVLMEEEDIKNLMIKAKPEKKVKSKKKEFKKGELKNDS